MDDKIITELKKKFNKLIISSQKITADAFIFQVRREDLSQILNHTYNNLDGFFLTMCGTDAGPTQDYFLLDYVLGWYEKSLLLIIRSKIPKADSKYPSIVPFISCADWYEREAKESLGIIPIGHPDPKKLLLSDDWPEGEFPLRKDYDYKARPSHLRESGFQFDYPANDLNIIPYGPYHFAIHEPIYFRFFVNGEKIESAQIRAGFNYRGLEKVAENRLTYETIPFMAERICGICGSTHSECYAQALEKSANIGIPERAKSIRIIVLEIERIHSHLLWFGFASHMIGFDSGLMQFFRVREKDMILAEILTGNRKTYGMITPGGVRRDITDTRRKRSLQMISEIKSEYEKLMDATLRLQTFTNRLKGIGILSKEDAKKHSVMGPTARGSGIDIDTRKNYPYENYDEMEFDIPVMSEGDALSRTVVRAYEVLESFKIIEQALESLPDGPVHVPIDYIPSQITSIGLVEGPRGTDVHYIITGEQDTVYRWRVRAPTYANLPVTPLILKGHTIADASIIVGSIDPCISCMERVSIVDLKNYDEKVILLSDKKALT